MIFFIVGFLCGRCHCRQKKKQSATEQIPSHVDSSVQQCSYERELEFQDNVSYATVQ